MPSLALKAAWLTKKAEVDFLISEPKSSEYKWNKP